MGHALLLASAVCAAATEGYLQPAAAQPDLIFVLADGEYK
jgi:hypothetical protein